MEELQKIEKPQKVFMVPLSDWNLQLHLVLNVVGMETSTSATSGLNTNHAHIACYGFLILLFSVGVHGVELCYQGSTFALSRST